MKVKLFRYQVNVTVGAAIHIYRHIHTDIYIQYLLEKLKQN